MNINCFLIIYHACAIFFRLSVLWLWGVFGDIITDILLISTNSSEQNVMINDERLHMSKADGKIVY